MSMYEPLREGFRELNRLVTDRQQFNAQQSAREAADNRQNRLLASQLEDRAFGRVMEQKRWAASDEMNKFNRDMRTKEHNLALSQDAFNKGDRIADNKRQADRLAMEKGMNEANLKIEQAKQRLARERFDLNKPIAEQAAQRAKEMGELDAAAKRMANEQAELLLDEEKEYVEEKPYEEVLAGMGILESPEIMENEEAAKELAEILGGHGKSLETGELVKKDGEPLYISHEQAADLSGRLLAFKAQYEITPAKLHREKAKLTNDRKQMSAQLKAINPNDERQIARRGALKQQLTALDSEVDKLDEQLTTEATLQRMEDKAETLRGGAKWAYDHRDQNTGRMLEKSAAEVEKAIEDMKIGGKGAGSGMDKTTQQWAVKTDENGNVVETVMLNVPKGAIGKITPENLDPSLNKDQGWKWQKGIGSVKGRPTAEKDWNQIHKAFINDPEYGLKDPSSGNMFIPEDRKHKYHGTMFVAKEMIKKNPNMSPMEIVVQAPLRFRDDLENLVSTAETVLKGMVGEERAIAIEEFNNLSWETLGIKLSEIEPGLKEDPAKEGGYLRSIWEKVFGGKEE